jgi:hypothetical protein
MNTDSDARVQSPRPDTPEPGSRQGRRNLGVQLLDDEGGISVQVYSCAYCFYCSRNLN